MPPPNEEEATCLGTITGQPQRDDCMMSEVKVAKQVWKRCIGSCFKNPFLTPNPHSHTETLLPRMQNHSKIPAKASETSDRLAETYYWIYWLRNYGVLWCGKPIDEPPFLDG